MSVNCLWHCRNTLFSHPHGDLIAKPKNSQHPGSNQTWDKVDALAKFPCSHTIPADQVTNIISGNDLQAGLQCPVPTCQQQTTMGDWKIYSRVKLEDQDIPESVAKRLLADRDYVYFIGPRTGLCIKVANFASTTFKLLFNVLHWTAYALTSSIIPGIFKTALVVAAIALAIFPSICFALGFVASLPLSIIASIYRPGTSHTSRLINHVGTYFSILLFEPIHEPLSRPCICIRIPAPSETPCTILANVS